ncbi:MAG: Mur ligase family protein [Gammaproteobacteria bacterium]|nr:Mur ligase family protein [Gammaproteobacteria bacterium]MDH3409519.1 Mur ligase family protein [Gammaproteobacteria bacterium]
MKFLDARRLTGPSLLFDVPGTILDVQCTPEEAVRLIPVWEKCVRRMLAELGWTDFEVKAVQLLGGVSVGFTAPIDALYAASEVNEWAWAAIDAELNGVDEPDFDQAVTALRAAIAEEANPELIRLEALAAEKRVTLLWDDDEASLGLGRHSETWPVRELPDPDALDWTVFKDVPCALITGTNGKTTTVRTAAHIVRSAGRSVGFSSTDYIAINDRIVDRDDWAGPGGARNVLREKGVDVGILETARGGLLRRGLGINTADAALITNIAKDHLGDFGSQDLNELLNCKWIISRAVTQGGKLILNADDPMLVAKSREFSGELVWFSLDSNNTVVHTHTSAGGAAFVLDDHEIVFLDGDARKSICQDRDVPITLGGAARHNAANALAAAALTWCIGISLADIRNGLMTMSQNANPGRGNVYEIDGFRVVVDFAHNPEAIQALLEMASRMKPRRKALCFGQAGDRPDDLIRELARSAWESGLNRVFVSELAKYHRGREEGAVFAVIRDELIACGARADQIEHHMEEIESLDAALQWAEPGDLIVMLALERSPELYENLRALAGSQGRDR